MSIKMPVAIVSASRGGSVDPRATNFCPFASKLKIAYNLSSSASARSGASPGARHDNIQDLFFVHDGV